jgi:hypothetical protein
MPFSQLGIFFREIVARPPQHRRIFAQTAAVQKCTVGLVTVAIEARGARRLGKRDLAFIAK